MILNCGDAVSALSHDHQSRWMPCRVDLQRYPEDRDVSRDVQNALWMESSGRLAGYCGRHGPGVVGLAGSRQIVTKS